RAEGTSGGILSSALPSERAPVVIGNRKKEGSASFPVAAGCARILGNRVGNGLRPFFPSCSKPLEPQQFVRRPAGLRRLAPNLLLVPASSSFLSFLSPPDIRIRRRLHAQQEATVKHGYLIDMDGVLYRGSELIPGADAFIRQLRALDIPFRLL